jgi:hypothetical protein
VTVQTKEPDPSNPAARRSWFEPVVLVLLSLATVAMAWCSFEAAAWGGVSQRKMNMSAAASRRAAAAQLQSYQMAVLDVILFSQHVNARASSNQALADFYATRFRAEAKTAFEKWMATHPFENTNAPPHPFVTNLYQPKLLADAREDEGEALQFWQEAGEAGRASRSYVLVTVLLASALFCGGTASKYEVAWVHQGVLFLGLAAFTFAAIRLLLLPVQL